MLAKGLGAVEAIAADDAFVYVARAGGAIVRIPLDGGEPLAVGQLDPHDSAMAMAVTAEGLYIATASGGEAALERGTFGQGSILLMPTDGGKVRALSSGYALMTSIIVDETKIYWAAGKGSKKPEWSIFSAPRRTGKPVTAKKLAQGGMTRVHAVYKGAVLESGLLGGVVAQSLGRDDKPGPTVATLMQVDMAVLAGDRLVVAGTELSMEGSRSVPTVGVASLEDPKHALDLLVSLPSEDHVGGLAIAEDGLYFTRVGTQQGHYRDGALVRISMKNNSGTVVATDLFQPGKVLATSRGVVWVNERGHLVGSDGDAEIMLLPAVVRR